MCRVVAYLGQPILLQELLYNPDNSLITQIYNPKRMLYMLNLAGFGIAAWEKKSIRPEVPFLYHTLNLPFYDQNLHNLSSKIAPDCLIAHVRGVQETEKNVISNQNIHPFLFEGTSLAFAHNGKLAGFHDMRFDLFKYTRPEFKSQIVGSTDSEAIYALFLSQLQDPNDSSSVTEIFSALIDTLLILKKIRKKHGVDISSPLNFFISDGNLIIATRFIFDYGHFEENEYLSPKMIYSSLWYTYGEKYECYENSYQMKPGKERKSIIISSEPLTEDSTTWLEIPEYSFIGACLKNNEILIKSIDVNI